jgi:glycosyltransferase involved in cell wall biosynthesis
LKILFPIGSFYPAQSGGPNNTIYWLAKRIVLEGHEVEVITTNAGIKEEHKIALDQSIDLDGIQARYCSTRFHQLPFSMIVHSSRAMKNADIVQLNSVFYIPSIIIAFIARLKGKKVIWSSRGELIGGAMEFRNFRKKVRLYFIKAIINKNFTFHGTSADELQSIKDHLKKEAILVPNYMEMPAKHEEEVQKQFLFIGRIHPIKALDNLIKGVAKSKLMKASGYKMIIHGYEDKAGYLNELKDLIKALGVEGQVEFRKPISSTKKLQEYAKSRFTFLVSKSENFGNTILESLSQGTPVVASKGTPWSELPKIQAGFWIEQSEEEIALCIDEILSMDESAYLSFRKNAFSYAHNEFDIDQKYLIWVEQYKNILQD